MSKPKCQWKGCTRAHLDLTFLMGKRKIPRFENQYYCSQDCLRAYLHQELAERWRRLEHDTLRKTLRPKLGTILLQTTLLTPLQLQEAVNLQRQYQNGRLGEWLMRLGFLEERQITQAIAKQFSLPVIDLKHSGARIEAVQLLPGRIAKSSLCLPVSLDDHQTTLRLAMMGPVNFSLQEAIRRMLNKSVLVYIGDRSAIESLLDRYYQNVENGLEMVPTYSSLDDLLKIAESAVDAAIENKAENIQTELLTDFFWARFDSQAGSYHLVYRHVSSLTQHIEMAPDSVVISSSYGSC
jgi:hypothetical protein